MRRKGLRGTLSKSRAIVVGIEEVDPTGVRSIKNKSHYIEIYLLLEDVIKEDRKKIFGKE